VRGGAEGEDALLGAALLLVATRAAEGRVEAVEVQRLLQPLGLPHVGVERAMVERVDPAFLSLRVLVDQQFHAAFARHAIAQLVHRLELPGRVDMQQRERRRRRIEGLARKVQHHRRILAHRVEHDRLLRFGHDLSQYVDAFRLQPFQMGQTRRHAGSSDVTRPL
jgi:hypothetical protein